MFQTHPQTEGHRRSLATTLIIWGYPNGLLAAHHWCNSPQRLCAAVYFKGKQWGEHLLELWPQSASSARSLASVSVCVCGGGRVGVCESASNCLPLKDQIIDVNFAFLSPEGETPAADLATILITLSSENHQSICVAPLRGFYCEPPSM